MKETIARIKKTKSFLFEKVKFTNLKIKSKKYINEKGRLQQTLQKYKGL